MGVNFSKVSFAYYKPRKKQKISFTLKDINLNIATKGEFLAVVGHTGSGKSTLVQLMNALLLPTSGIVDIFGSQIKRKVKVRLKPIRQKVGLVFQFPEYQIFEETVKKDIMFGPKNFGMNLEEAEKRIEVIAKTIGIEEKLLQKSPFNLSGGQMRKVAICGILASDPEIIILDEPTVGLDPFGKGELLEFLKELNTVYNKTIIVITHDMEVVSRYAKRAIVLNHGSLLYDGTTNALFKEKDLIDEFNLDYPEIVKTLMILKDKLNLDIDVYKYNEQDAFMEIKRVMNNGR